jgi:hypothetical protein
MFHRFARALKIANRDSGFAQIFGAALLLVIVGTLTYAINQDWSIVDAFYFAIATLTNKIFTVFYILIGIGILVELVRQVGFAFVEVRREDQAAKQAKKDAKLDAGST